MHIRGRRSIAAGVGILALLVLCGLGVFHAMAADPIVGEWNYTTANHWSKGPVPAGKPSSGVVVITQSGDQFNMEFKSGMVFNPPKLKNFTGNKNGQDYNFSNSARTDEEGGVAKNNCDLKMMNPNQLQGKSYSQWSNGVMTFSWGFDITLTR
jgi:hypothetical protein